MLAHWAQSRGSPISAGYLDSIAPLATLGVQIFFVISGFLITGILLSELERTRRIDLVRFYFRRTLRIFPAFYVFVVAAIVFSLAGFTDKLDARWLVPPITYSTNYFGSNWLLGHTWSLAIEEQFYLLWPAILLLLGKRKGVWIAVAAVVLAPAVRAYYMENGLAGFHFEAFMDGIAVGCLLAALQRRIAASAILNRVLRSPVLLVVPVLLLALTEATVRPRLGPLFYAADTLIYLTIAVGIYAAIHRSGDPVTRFLNHKAVARVGVLSYSIYLWQQMFLSPFDTPFVFPWNILLVLPFAWLSYVAVESPMLRLRQRLEPRLFRATERQEAGTATLVSIAG